MKRRCLELLTDLKKLIASGDNATKAPKEKFEEAAEPVLKCLKGGHDILKAAVKDCNPATGAPGPVACAQTVLNIPEIIADCQNAYGMIREALRLRRTARSIYGRAAVSFSDFGGDDIAADLATCGETTCLDLSNVLYGVAVESGAAADRDIEKLEKLLKDLGEVDEALRECSADTSQCREVPMSEIPTLEGIGDEMSFIPDPA